MNSEASLDPILSAAWHMPLSIAERITFMRSSALVNSTWADIFNLVALRDVYIPSAAFSDHFLQRLCAQPTTVASSSGSFERLLDCFRSLARPHIQPTRTANLACQSLTIQITNDDVYPAKSGHMRLPMGGVLDSLLETLDAWSLAPNLRRLSIEYVDTGFEDIFNRVGLAALPPQITHLDLRYSFSDAMPIWLVESLRRKQQRQRRFGWTARGVTRLSVTGAGESTITDLLFTCPNVQTLGRERGSVQT